MRVTPPSTTTCLLARLEALLASKGHVPETSSGRATRPDVRGQARVTYPPWQFTRQAQRVRRAPVAQAPAEGYGFVCKRDGGPKAAATRRILAQLRQRVRDASGVALFRGRS